VLWASSDNLSMASLYQNQVMSPISSKL